MDRPDYVKDEHLKFLNELRASGTVNMLAAPRLLDDEFPDLADDRPSFRASKKAQGVFKYWTEAFTER